VIVMADIEFMEDIRGGKLDYKMVISRALDRIHSLCYISQNVEQSMINEVPRRIIYGIELLEMLLKPYLDDKYKGQIKKLKKRKKEKKLDSFSFALKKFGYLCCMLDRLNMLLEREATDSV